MRNKPLNEPDPRALKILSDTYWTSTGWRDAKSRSTPSEEFEYAKRAGVMFDPIRLSHDEIVDRAIRAARTVDRRTVADAFVASLSTRRLDLRSALGSFAVLQHFPPHKRPPGRGNCPVCGAYDRAAEPEDLNVLNFERFKWGGVRHDQPLYAAFDLELFARLPRPSPTPEDIDNLQAILAAIEAAPAETSSASLAKLLPKGFKSNKAERDVLIGILGLCGVLGTAAHPGYMTRFVPWSARELPDRRFVDMAYPACWWTRTDGVNRDAVSHWFGHLL